MASGVGTTGEGPAQLEHQEAGGLRIAPLSKTHTLRPDEMLPREVQPPQQGPSSERNVTSVSSPGQFDVKRITPSALKAADSDIDYFNDDEDNDALLALEDSVLQGAESYGSMTARITSIGHNADRSAMKNESSPGGTHLQVAAASVSYRVNESLRTT
ncbi:hypothetical protein BJV78DRAFT_935042 [Lactifluus subvellereus]|nr:hypothetical protein BJV78DRAFT_935042 [Lactifluus subvellereus]